MLPLTWSVGEGGVDIQSTHIPHSWTSFLLTSAVLNHFISYLSSTIVSLIYSWMIKSNTIFLIIEPDADYTINTFDYLWNKTYQWIHFFFKNRLNVALVHCDSIYLRDSVSLSDWMSLPPSHSCFSLKVKLSSKLQHVYL